MIDAQKQDQTVDEKNQPLKKGLYSFGKDNPIFIKTEGKTIFAHNFKGEQIIINAVQYRDLFPINDPKNYISRLKEKKVIMSISYKKGKKIKTIDFPKQTTLSNYSGNIEIEQKIRFIQSRLEGLASEN